jgi:hypothetical protein
MGTCVNMKYVCVNTTYIHIGVVEYSDLERITIADIPYLLNPYRLNSYLLNPILLTLTSFPYIGVVEYSDLERITIADIPGIYMCIHVYIHRSICMYMFMYV